MTDNKATSGSLAPGEQKYCPVRFAPPAMKLAQRTPTESPRMRSAHIPIVNPVTSGDRTLTRRVYESGKLGRTRS